MPLSFSTKAATLALLRPILSSERIAPLYPFLVLDCYSDKKSQINAVPTVIGAGEILCPKWSRAKRFFLDCVGRQIVVLE